MTDRIVVHRVETLGDPFHHAGRALKNRSNSSAAPHRERTLLKYNKIRVCLPIFNRMHDSIPNMVHEPEVRHAQSRYGVFYAHLDSDRHPVYPLYLVLSDRSVLSPTRLSSSTSLISDEGLTLQRIACKQSPVRWINLPILYVIRSQIPSYR